MLLSNYQMLKAETLIRDGIKWVGAGTQSTIVGVQIQTTALNGCVTLASCLALLTSVSLFVRWGKQLPPHAYYVVK